VTAAKKSAEVAACDAQILMWALPWAMRPEKKRRAAPQNVPEMRRRAKILLKMLTNEGVDLCIPSVVILELLAGVEIQKHAKVLSEFEARFSCPPFDARASALAARLYQFERGLPGRSRGLPKEERTDRPIIKSDVMIVASAKVAGATRFYSHDAKCRRLAKEAGMEALDLPTTSGNFATDQEATEEEAQDRDI
jgi:predicted nucleic acid-binding protein